MKQLLKILLQRRKVLLGKRNPYDWAMDTIKLFYVNQSVLILLLEGWAYYCLWLIPCFNERLPRYPWMEIHSIKRDDPFFCLSPGWSRDLGAGEMTLLAPASKVRGSTSLLTWLIIENLEWHRPLHRDWQPPFRVLLFAQSRHCNQYPAQLHPNSLIHPRTTEHAITFWKKDTESEQHSSSHNQHQLISLIFLYSGRRKEATCGATLPFAPWLEKFMRRNQAGFTVASIATRWIKGSHLNDPALYFGNRYFKVPFNQYLLGFDNLHTSPNPIGSYYNQIWIIA